MQRHFEKELEGLKTTLIKMGSLAEEAIGLSIQALLKQDAELAKRVIDNDWRINSLEMETDNAIVDLLALQQPVAIDLRLILAATKINNDLERIGDHAVNIAESALAYCERRPAEPLLGLPRMADLTQKMLRDALDSFIHNDPHLSSTVLTVDDHVDELNREMASEVIELIRKDADLIEGGLQVLRVSRNLERVADLATNIAEEVIFIAEARIVKHHAFEGGAISPKPSFVNPPPHERSQAGEGLSKSRENEGAKKH
jgi:phosphate transport system protein